MKWNSISFIIRDANKNYDNILSVRLVENKEV